MLIKAHVKRNVYFDSITLMKIARSLTGMPGVEDAAAIMATEPNLQLLAEAGLTPPEIKANPSDVLLVVRAIDDPSAEDALQAAEAQLSQRNAGAPGVATGVGVPLQPRSLEQAVAQHPEARLAAISVPGPHAAFETERALRAGLHVFLFSDNVRLEDEIALKHLAQERNLLLMGPDCGTAMLNGVGLGFINVVSPGPIGIVGASGTGIQQVMSLIAQQGSGISQVIGSGGRDLSESVGAITTLQGLRLLQEDEQTQLIVIVSKPPAPTVAEQVIEVAAAGKKLVVAIFVGADHDALQHRYGDRVIIAHTLAEAAQRAVAITMGVSGNARNVVAPLVGAMGGGAQNLGGTLSGGQVSMGVGAVGMGARPQQRIVGLFSGGTLCDEAMQIWTKQFAPIYSNIPLNPAWRLVEGQPVAGHCAIDFGADEYTRGRPHPMIDPTFRLKRFQEEAVRPDVGVILLDIVLGYCSHPDPAAVYGSAILAARQQAAQNGRVLNCVISLCGTEGDPQRLSVQAARFSEAGAEVFMSNADAALRCIELIS